PGDLLSLDEHQVLCGDAGNAQDVDRLLDGAAVHLVHTDPPYNCKVEPRSNNAIAAGLSSFPAYQRLDTGRDLCPRPANPKPTTKKLRAKDRPLANDFLPAAEFEQRLRVWFANLARVLLPGRSYYIWAGYDNLGNYPRPLAENGLYFSQAIVWNKEHPTLT